ADCSRGQTHARPPYGVKRSNKSFLELDPFLSSGALVILTKEESAASQRAPGVASIRASPQCEKAGSEQSRRQAGVARLKVDSISRRMRTACADSSSSTAS